MAVDRDRVPAERLGAPHVAVEVPADHRLARLAEPVDVDDRRQVVEAVEGGVLERLPDRALGHLGVAAQAPDAVGQAVEPACPPARRRRAIGRPWPSEPVATSVGGIRGVGWPSSRESSLRNVEQLGVVDDARRLEHRVVQRRGVALGEDQVVVAPGCPGRSCPAQVAAVEQHRHQVGGRHRRGRVAGAGGRAGADGVHPQLLAELAAKRSRSLMPRHHRVALGLDVGEQLLERLGELLHALALERLDDVVVVDPGRRERLERAARAVDVLLERVARPRRGPGTPRRSRAASC